MEDQDTIDGLPILKKKTATTTNTVDGLPILKKKVNSDGGQNISLPSVAGSNLIPNSPQSTQFSPIIDEPTRQANIDRQRQQSTALSQQLQANYDRLDPELKKAVGNIPIKHETVDQTPQSEVDHMNFMNSTLGKIVTPLAYLGSKATHGTLQIAKGVAHMANMANNPAGMGLPEATDPLFDKVDKLADFNLTQGDISRIEDSKKLSNSALSAAGMAAQFAPAVLGGEIGETAHLPKAIMYLQGVGMGKEVADKIPSLNPLAKEALIQGSGVVNLALTDIGNNVFNKGVSSAVKDKVISGIAADAIKESAGKDLTAPEFKSLLEGKAQDFATKFERAPSEVLKHYTDAAKTFTKLDVGNFALHKGVDAIQSAEGDKPVFNENLGNLAEKLSNSMTKAVPMFGFLGAVGSASKLLPNSSYENDVVKSAMSDPSSDNIDLIKQQLQAHGEQQGWTPDEIQATHDHVDKIAKAAKSLPTTIPEKDKSKAVGLVLDRNVLQDELAKMNTDKKQLDPSIQDLPTAKEQYLTDKVEQANDKLRDIVGETKSTYSKGVGDEEGKFFKTVNGDKEEISPSRYELERMERDAKKETINPPIENESTNEKNGQESSQSSEESRPENGSESQKSVADEERNVVNSGEAQAEPVTNELQDGTNTTEPTPIIAGEVQPSETTAPEETPKVEKEPTEPEPEAGEVKKTILTKRAYEGEIQEDVKKHLEEKGLNRKTFSQEERSKQATDFINKFGEETAVQAIKSGDIDGGMAASILTQLQIRNSHAMGEFPIGSDEREELAKKQANLIELAEKKGYLGGEFNGQLAYEYQNSELNYANVKRQVENSTNKPLTDIQDKKIKELTSENEKLKNQLQDAEAKLIDETDKALDGKTGLKETKTQKSKRLADRLRQNAKLHKPNVFSSANPASLAWDTAIEIVAKSIETGGKLADAIDKGIEHIKSTDWYKSLPANKKSLAEDEFKKFNNEHSGSTNLEDLQERFLDKKDNKFSPSEARDIWGYIKENYIEKGVSYQDAIAKTAEDLGLSWRQVSEAVITPKNKRASDEMWKKVSESTRYRTAIKDWVNDQNKNPVSKGLKKLSGAFRGLAVFGHGGIFMGTHAGMTLFNPSTWNKTIPAFFRGWKFAYGNEGEYQKAVEELKHAPNYLLAQRAGLKNNPERLNTDEYQRSQKFLGKLGLAGERGFNAVKVLRQDLFDYHYNKLTPAERDDPATAASIAHLVNLATGATNLKIPSWVNEVSFAGGMEASRWEKLTASPVKAAETALKAILTPEKATTSEKVFAKVWSRRVGEQLATYGGVLLANAAIQNTLNPKNPVNLTNPNKPDFLKFKFGDLTIDPTSGMRSTAMFMRTLGKIPFEDKKDLHGDKRIAVAGKNVANYARGKLAPLYSTIADVYSGQDYNGNVMPYSKEKAHRPSHNLTYTEYALSKAPLPVAEAINVAYKSALEHGAHKNTLDAIMKGFLSGAISGTTGFRVGEYDANAPANKHKK